MFEKLRNNDKKVWFQDMEAFFLSCIFINVMMKNPLRNDSRLIIIADRFFYTVHLFA